MEFADIALAKFLQTAPELSPYIVNFIDVSDQMGAGEGDVKVGVFIVKVGAGIATIPVVAKGEVVFPIDSVFVEEEAQFKPLNAATIKYLMNSTGISQGSSAKIPEYTVKNPNLYGLINPPRTGKFVYSSASRLTEFFAAIPAPVRKFALEKIATEHTVYDTLDKLFGLKAIFTVLNGTHGGTGPVNSVQTGPEKNLVNESISVATTPHEIKALANENAAKAYIDKGFVVSGNPDAFRVAVAYMPYNKLGVYKFVSPAVDGGKDFDIVMKDGTNKEAFLPKYHVANPVRADRTVSIFSDGNYARGQIMSSGDPLDREEVLKSLFNTRLPKLLKDLERGEEFVMFLSSGEALGPFYANSVTRTAVGTEVNISNYAGKVRKICGYNNFTKDVECMGDTLFVQHNVIVLSLGADVTMDVETSVNDAAGKKELIASQFLGATLDLRHDGIEFSANGQSIGSTPVAMKHLVEVEKIDPDMAENFLKQAEEIQFVKIFMSKTAADGAPTPTEIPSYGVNAPESVPTGLNGSFLPVVKDATSLGDSQAIESTIIAQLLQVPELFPYIGEYLPELEQTVDRLGRILFLSRVKVDQLSEALDSDSVFSVVAQIKTVYRQLGDTVLKLKGLTTAAVGFDKDNTVGQVNGS